jgi:sugar phosphate permease
MDGVSGYEGWRWIFILEGIVTVIVAVASFWMLYDYPDTAKFLTTSERKVLQARLLLDNDGCSHEYKRRFIRDAFLDWKIWVAAIMFHAALMPVYTFSIFSPTLTANLGYTAATAQLVSCRRHASRQLADI